MLEAARETVGVLPADDVGRAVLAPVAGCSVVTSAHFATRSPKAESVFHPGSIRGAMPRLV